ncbi:MAG: MMPL family transporter, partial [Planctomycetota bacterium]
MGQRLRWLYRYSIRHPKTVMVIAVGATLAIAPGILRLKIRTDGHALVPADAEQVVFDRQVRNEFGVEDPVVVLIRSDDPHGIFNPHTVRLIKDLTAAFKNIEGVRPSDVTSLDTEHNYRVIQGTLRFRTFLDPLPQTRQELDALRADIRDIKLYDGTVIGFDDAFASILVGVPAQTGRAALYTRIQDIIAGLGEVPEEIHVIGAPVAEALLGTHILEDLGVPNAVLGHRLGRAEERPWRFPRSLYELRLAVAQHLGLAPTAIGIMMLVFLLSFRRLTAALMPLLEVLACLVAVFGLMGWCGVPVYLTIAVLPVILTVSGVQDEIHLFNRCVRELRERPDQDQRAAVRTAMDEMYPAVFKTTVTTAVGYLCFAFSSQAPVQAFGLFASVGMLYCMLWSFAVIPAQLAMIPPRRWLRWHALDAESGPSLSGRFFGKLCAGVVRYRHLVVAVAVLLTALAPLGVRKIVVQDSWIDGFARDSEFYQATQTFNDHFLGTHMLLVHLDTGHKLIAGELKPEAVGDHRFLLPGNLVDDPATLVGQRIYFERSGSPLVKEPQPPPQRHRKWESRKSYIESATREGDHVVIKTPAPHALVKAIMRLVPGEKLKYEITPQRLVQPEVLRRIGELEEFIRAHRAEAVGGVIGPADYVATTRFMKMRKEEKRRIPDSSEEVEILWGDYKNIRGEERLRQIVDTHFARCLVSVFMKNANFVDTRRLMDAIRAYEREHLSPQGIRLRFAGDVAVSQTLIEAIVTTQVRSLLASPLGILVITVVLGRSLLWGVLSVLPCVLGLLLNFAVIGLVGMPLGVASSMFACMILGIGVDYAIHLVERYRLCRARGLDWEEALTDAMTHTGPPILVDAVSVAFGFSVMMLSQVPANARLGGLLVLSIAGCLVTTLLLLPALLSLGRARGRLAPEPPNGTSVAAQDGP